MNKNLVIEDTEYLYNAVLSLKNTDECQAFFEDLCTYNELLAMVQRINVAKRLSDGETQTEIIEKTGASSATISRVNRTYRYGNGAYRLVFARITEKDSNENSEVENEQ